MHRPPLVKVYIDKTPQPRRPTLYIASSWLWASIDGGITYESQRLNSTSNDIHQRPEESVVDYDFR